jgi:hypothetical protein
MVYDDKWHSVVHLLFFISDEVFSVNTTCFVKTMVNAHIVVTPLFHRFFDHANNVHPTIKFTHETSRNNISFLDTYTTCENIQKGDVIND